jgi:hypothetical protein
MLLSIFNSHQVRVTSAEVVPLGAILDYEIYP